MTEHDGVAGHPAYVNLADLLTHQATVEPDTEAAVQPLPERHSLSLAALDGQVGAVAAGLVGHGLVAGLRVGLVAPNSLQFVVAYLAALRAGLVAVPVDPDLPPPERNAMLRTCGVAVVLAAEDVTELEAATRPLTVAGLSALAQPDGGPVTSPRGATGQVQKGRLRGSLAEADR